MPRTNDVNKQIKDERRSSILSVSAPLFALCGDKVSVDMICEKAKCSHGLLYHYFRDTNNVLFNIKKSERYLALKDKILTIKDNGSPIDSIYQIIQTMNGLIAAAKQDDISLLILLMQDDDKDGVKSTLTSTIKQGQKDGQICAGKPEEICNIYLNQNIGVLYRKLLQKSYKIEISPIDNLIQIFNKKRF